MNKITFHGTKVPVRLNSFKDSMKGSMEGGPNGAAELINSLLQYQRQLITMCSQKLSSSYPKLVLKKVSLSDTTNSLEPPAQQGIDEFDDQSSPSLSIEDFGVLQCFFSLSIREYESLRVNKVDQVSQRDLTEVIAEHEGAETSSLNLEDQEDPIPKLEAERRSLRVVHTCETCKRTFSSVEKFNAHQNSDCSGLQEDFEGMGVKEDDFTDVVSNVSEESEEDEDAVDKNAKNCKKQGLKRKLPEITSERPLKQKREDLEKGEDKKCLNLLTVCPDCFQFFNRFYEMITHWKLNHFPTSKDKPLIVEVINYTERVEEDFTKKFLISEECNFEVFARIELPSNIFTCGDCKQMFFYEEDLQAHSALHGQFKCQFCEVVKKYAVDLAEHELKNHSVGVLNKNENFPSMECPRCLEKFSYKHKNSYLRHHLADHLGIERLLEQCCPICRDPFRYYEGSIPHGKRKKLLEKHFRKEHNLEGDKLEKEECKIEGCAAYYSTRKKLFGHFRIVHSQEKDRQRAQIAFRRLFAFKCKDCGKNLKSNKILKMHRVRYHVPVEKLIFCTVKGCEHKFEFQQDLEAHLKNGHRGEGMEVCPKCGKCVASWSFAHHLKSHKPKRKVEFVCEKCGKSFKGKAGLEQHRLQVHDSKAWKAECPVCFKKFPHKYTLVTHMRVHTGEKPFVCQICGQAYSHRHNLRIHVNSKHGDVMQDLAKKRDTSNDAPKRKGKGVLSKLKK